ncbi:Mov34/MPN/PAD-1 family protein [Candidatus Micrarchaeota archaeon]|nr:Mov34/MPN/PAD-1 family protein [Candidatus Micrarchaeota archaeon]
MFDVYILESVIKRVEEHFSYSSLKGLEALGLLAGRVFSFEGRHYVVAEDYLTASNDATAVSVRFQDGALSALAKALKDGQIFVAWCHSHPGYGCFLSATDLRTQKDFFNEPFHVALVVDPVRGEKKFFKLKKEDYAEASYAVVRKKHGK